MVEIKTEFGEFKTFMSLFMFLHKNNKSKVHVEARTPFGIMKRELTLSEIKRLADIEARG